jgi:hypothetical protein
LSKLTKIIHKNGSVVHFSEKPLDSHNAYEGGPFKAPTNRYRFTVPLDGTYRIGEQDVKLLAGQVVIYDDSGKYEIEK